MARTVVQREDESFNAATFWRFLRRLRKRTAAGKHHVVLVLDNVRYHHAILHKPWREACQDRFELLFLPPYSPELNPIEHVWKLTRRLATHNRYFPHLESIVQAVEGVFNQWGRGSETLRRLCTMN